MGQYNDCSECNGQLVVWYDKNSNYIKCGSCKGIATKGSKKLEEITKQKRADAAKRKKGK